MKRKPISYSLWFMPAKDQKVLLENKIKTLANQHGGPKFDPHVTLLSSFFDDESTLLYKTKNLSKKIRSFEIIFDQVRYLNEFFRSLFIEIKFSEELKSVRSTAAKEFGWKDKNYIPHLSLMYGNYSDQIKINIIKKMGALPKILTVNKIYLVHNDEINFKWKVIEGFKINN